jgi:hypothetical protein
LWEFVNHSKGFLWDFLRISIGFHVDLQWISILLYRILWQFLMISIGFHADFCIILKDFSKIFQGFPYSHLSIKRMNMEQRNSKHSTQIQSFSSRQWALVLLCNEYSTLWYPEEYVMEIVCFGIFSYDFCLKRFLKSVWVRIK